jgi:AraC-like DNA-binding protein
LRTGRCGTISQVTSRPAAAQNLRDLATLRRVRDRIDREYAQPLDVEALARGGNMSAGHLSREFRRLRRVSVRLSDDAADRAHRGAAAGLLVTCAIVPRRTGVA